MMCNVVFAVSKELDPGNASCGTRVFRTHPRVGSETSRSTSLEASASTTRIRVDGRDDFRVDKLAVTSPLSRDVVTQSGDCDDLAATQRNIASVSRFLTIDWIV